MQYTKETPIGSDRAKQILEAAGCAGDFDHLADWYISTTAEGGEYLTMGGHDLPVCFNPGTTWHSPGAIVAAKEWQPG